MHLYYLAFGRVDQVFFFFQVILLLVSFFLPNEDMNLRYVSFWALEKVLASQPVAGAAVLRRWARRLAACVLENSTLLDRVSGFSGKEIWDSYIPKSSVLSQFSKSILCLFINFFFFFFPSFLTEISKKKKEKIKKNWRREKKKKKVN